jgi:hypothetical protein
MFLLKIFAWKKYQNVVSCFLKDGVAAAGLYSSASLAEDRCQASSEQSQ